MSTGWTVQCDVCDVVAETEALDTLPDDWPGTLPGGWQRRGPLGVNGRGVNLCPDCGARMEAHGWPRTS